MGPSYRPPKEHRHKLSLTSTAVRIIEKLSPLSYRVALPAHSRIHDVLSIVHLKRFNGVSDDVRPLPVNVDDGGDEFEVEEIRVRGSGLGKWNIRLNGKVIPTRNVCGNH